MIKISFVTTSDIHSIAHLHHQELPGLLSELGEDFLRAFYRGAFRAKGTITLIAKKDKAVLGYALVGFDRRAILGPIISENPREIITTSFLAFLRRPSSLQKLVQIPFAPKFSPKEICGEILSLAVDRSSQRKGVGRALFKSLQKELRRVGVSKFVVMTFTGLSKANAFYKAMGGKLILEKRFLGEQVRYYCFGL